MTITRKHLGDMERCYSVGSLSVDKMTYALFASERVGGECCAYPVNNLSEREILWENAGGTMSLVEVPGSNGEILGVQNFFPKFQAAEAKIVWVKRSKSGGWLTQDFITLPYVHRFDILHNNGINYFMAATLCSSKQSPDDWSDPGKVYVGVLPETPEKMIKIEPLLTGLVKNHGYWRGLRNNRACGFFSAENGVFSVSPPDNLNGSWVKEQILDFPVSDIAVYDIDGDGEDEIVAIEPFHGDSVKIYHKSGKGYSEVYSYSRECKFAHAIWAGKLRGKPSVLLGCRRMSSELVVLQYNPEKKSYTETVIEEKFGPSNVAVITQKDQDLILCANNSAGEAAVFFVTD